MKSFQYRGWDVVIVRGNHIGSSYSYLIHKDGMGKTGNISLSGGNRSSAFGIANSVAHLVMWATAQEDRGRAWMKEQEA